MTLAVLLILIINGILLAVLLLRKTSDASSQLKSQFESLEKNLERTERLVREEMSRNRDELGGRLNAFGETFSKQLMSLIQNNEQKLDKMREVVEKQLRALQEDNSQKLEKMRETVDEKLHSTLEKRLGESFKMVSDRLEKVHQGLGEMQSLAVGVGDLKKVLSNVKTRGIWGEAQLENLLEQILTPEQYEKNVVTKPRSQDRVEFAIKLPGRDGEVVLLPIDAKFPVDDYDRLQNAQEAVNVPAIEEAGKALETRLKLEGNSIRDKYLDPPHTTDFGILFLPTESLYAEVLRRPGLADQLRREFRVIVTGPTTLAALLNSLQMGFRTLAVEKRASEVWTLLGAVKAEFGKFAQILENTQTKLRQASDTIEDAARKTRTIEKKLKDVQDMPSAAGVPLLEQKDADAVVD